MTSQQDHSSGRENDNNQTQLADSQRAGICGESENFEAENSWLLIDPRSGRGPTKIGSYAHKQIVHGSIHNTYNLRLFNEQTGSSGIQYVRDRNRDEFRAKCLDSLAMFQSRFETTTRAHRYTCQWMLTHHEYQNWLDDDRVGEHHGLLWIRGKPATGKSTIMKFLYSYECSIDREDHIVIAHFFNARGVELERSIQGLCRSLITTYFRKSPDMQHLLDDIEPISGQEILQFAWTVEKLKDLVRKIVVKLDRRKLVLFIDAVDECDEDEIRDLISFLEELIDITSSEGNILRACLSSRHYPHITIRHGGCIRLEDQVEHQNDIERYIGAELHVGSGRRTARISHKIGQKAAGVFLWVALVISKLNQCYDQGRVRQLEDILDRIPDKLELLIASILSLDERQEDRTHKQTRQETELCLQWVLFAKRPLHPRELYFAIVSETEKNFDPNWLSQELSEQDVSRFIINCSKGLTEETGTSNNVVQFIHESVREFLLRKYEDGGNELTTFSSATVHERLKQCCTKYMIEAGNLIANDLQVCGGTKWHKVPLSRLQDLIDRIPQEFPFLRYAVGGSISHGNDASAHICQISWLQRFDIDQWILLNNLTTEYMNRWYPADTSLLYVLSERNLADLLSQHLAHLDTMDLMGGKFGHPLFVAWEFGNSDAVRVLLASSTQENTIRREQTYTFDDLVPQLDAICAKRYNPTSTSPLAMAAGLGLKLLVKQLLATGKVSIDLENGEHHRTALGFACASGEDDIAGLLLASGAKIDSTNAGCVSALAEASRRGHLSTVELLLRHGANFDVYDDLWGTPLIVASSFGHIVVAQALIRAGANLDIGDGLHEPALNIAALKEDLTLMRLLISAGANVNTPAFDNGTALEISCKKRNMEQIGLLIESGADVNAQGLQRWTALFRAIGMRDVNMMKLLLEAGADPNLPCNVYGQPCTPLKYVNAQTDSLWRSRERSLLLQYGGK